MSHVVERINLQTHYVNITDHLQEDLTKLAKEKVEHLSTSYFKSILKKEDAEIKITMNMEKNSDDLFEGKFHFNMDGDAFHYHNDTPFKEPYDVVSHAFKHLKEYLANK